MILENENNERMIKEQLTIDKRSFTNDDYEIKLQIIKMNF